MALQRQNLNINFAQGLDQKTDPKQISPGKFLLLQNSIFQKGGLLSKRNGFKSLPSLPDTSSQFVTTFNGNLTAIGADLKALSMGSDQWITKGTTEPLELTTLPLIRNNFNQSMADSAVSSNNLVCTVYTEDQPTPVYKYVVADSITGQNIVAPTLIPAGGGVVSGSQRVFVLGNHFVILFTDLISGTYHLRYFTISISQPTNISTVHDISTQYTPTSTTGFDGYVANNNLYIAFNGTDLGGSVRVTYLDQFLSLHSVKVFTGHAASIVTITADQTGNSPIIYVTYYDTTNAYCVVLDYNLNTVTAPFHVITTETVLNLASTAQSGQMKLFYEIDHNYGYDSSIPTHFLRKKLISQSGSVGSASTFIRSVGLASKAFLVNQTSYMLSIYFSENQPSYFLINESGQILLKLAYENASGYYVAGLPSVTVNSNIVNFAYFFKDLVQAVNKSQGLTAPNGVYSQLGINLATVQIGTSDINTAEIGSNLMLSGGFLWSYDGYSIVEQGFHLWPDNVEVTTSTTGGFLDDQTYFYQAIYEWTDNQGNPNFSAASIPVEQITTGGDTSSNTINIPTLRLTYKTANPVKISIFRWSTAQQTYYQITSINAPLINDTTIDYVTFVDTQNDADILGNNIIYTTGGVIEDIGAPATKAMALFKSRLFLIDAEDPNLLWYSKQVIEGTPVEMSDLFTIYIAPTTGAQGSTGPTECLSAMDDKLIAFKKDAIYYITGNGPDNTGANNDFSDAIYITGTVGCDNQKSIVLTPAGLMFQSDKGIWLLGRDLSTQYIGAQVEDFTTGSLVVSALVIPGTNQVRFSMDSGVTLMYDYYYGQWGTFTGIPSISSTLYEGLHTYINSLGQTFQENVGSYTDGSSPVLMSFTTGWFTFAGLQGFQRAYDIYLLGQYYSPHKLKCEIVYDFNPGITQTAYVLPSNFNPVYGDDPIYGSLSPYGGASAVEKPRIFLTHQKCQAFQLSVSEIFDGSFGTAPGYGLTLSGLNFVFGIKKGNRTTSAAENVS